MAETPSETGSIVALEGDQDTIATQLRLLPTSQNILILPSLDSFLPKDADEYGFSAAEFVGRIHTALSKRHDVAREFLANGPSTGRKLVFLNGGVAGAQERCLRAIMEHETAGDEMKAGLILSRLVKKGAYALAESNKRKKRASKRFHPSEYDDFGPDSDPITQAMRAADALDRQTANLQPSTDLDLTARRHSRSSSLPLYGYSDNIGDAAPFLVFGAPSHGEQFSEQLLEEASLKTPRFSVISYGEQKEMPSIFGFDDLISAKASPSVSEGMQTPLAVQDVADSDAVSPMSEAFSIRTLDTVVFGRASVLDVRQSVMLKRQSISRVKSLDRLQPLSPKFRDICLPEASTMTETQYRPKSWTLGPDGAKHFGGQRLDSERPRSVLVRTTQPTIKINPVPEGKKRRKISKQAYIDDAKSVDSAGSTESVFEPVFPLVEHLVVHLKNDTANLLLASALDAFKDGRYLYQQESTTRSETSRSDSIPETPTSSPQQQLPQDESKVIDSPPEANSSSSYTTDDEYDPFAYTNPSFTPPKPTSSTIPTVTIIRPPTPAQTPPPTTTPADPEPTHRVKELQLTSNQTPVSLQNTLRSILAGYFPPEEARFQFPLLQELKGLWQPIFRQRRSEDSSASAEGRKLKQILAIGLQRGVKKEYGARVIGQLERFGTEPSGSARCSRLDFRYLLANTMQSFTSQPLANQMSDNPFTNPYLLATFIMPHLDTYLALHTDIRYLLLEYPPDHLATVVALQKLAGVELVKVAQIVDSSSKDELPFRHIRGASIGSSSEPKSFTSSHSSKLSSEVSINKANFLLTSTASDKDIAKFVSAVWNIEAKNRPPSSNTSEKASLPTTSSSPKPKRKPKPAPLALTAFPKAIGPQSPLSPTANFMSVLAPPPKSPSPSQVTAIRPNTTPAFKPVPPPTPSKSLSGKRPDDAMSVFTFDPREDSDYDEEERRLMPMFLQKRKPRKGNSKKALQFLGLTV